MPKTSTTASASTAAPRAKRARRATTLGRRARRTASPVSTVSHEQIAVRAYEIHLSDTAGDPLDHWLAAERELAGA
jgi:hypothetical protein